MFVRKKSNLPKKGKKPRPRSWTTERENPAYPSTLVQETVQLKFSYHEWLFVGRSRARAFFHYKSGEGQTRHSWGGIGKKPRCFTTVIGKTEDTAKILS